jgi:hypothetical protein
MLDNMSDLGQIAVHQCLTFLHLLFSFCYLAVLELLDISPL